MSLIQSRARLVCVARATGHLEESQHALMEGLGVLLR